MMFDIKYHPLIDADSDGKEKVPMFMGADKHTVSEHHSLYLEEIVPYCFRLCSSKPLSAKETEELTIHCPYCNAGLRAISTPTDGTRHALYECPRCKCPQGRSIS